MRSVELNAFSTEPIWGSKLQSHKKPVDVGDIPSKILEVIYKYLMTKFGDSNERISQGTPKFLSVISKFVAEKKTVQMCLPAFPWKSANKVYKVLGSLPDKAEEVALKRLNTMCEEIAEVYDPGATLIIISDGLVYNDLLTIPDRDTWADLVSFPGLPAQLNEIIYVANASNFRRYLLNKFGNDSLDVDNEIATKPDTNMTYRGYCRFLGNDLQYLYPVGKDRSGHAYRRDVKFLAKEMLKRGDAFAKAVKFAFPDHLRLSIHQSTGEHKISVSLLPTDTGYTTPWHCSVAFRADGSITSGPKGDFEKDSNLELVYENGRPSYFQEKAAAGEAVN
ncbi:putative transferase family protein [Eutypa lata UCREL1]|uniref:Putative transferase family protein n=1 Tax=Eutypa lata (strain UCR-EL1) TaxID=1287681 RepID=M7SEW1_EUTLA|nr:putative transferase family protein [Eutypa lata UCREL1]